LRAQRRFSYGVCTMPDMASICQDWRLPPRYEIRQLIGTGSYGHVVEAYDCHRNELVAIKRIARVFEDLIDCKRILREIAILSALDHDCVVRLYDICVPEDPRHYDELYIVLEICDSDFKKLFRTSVNLTETMVKTLLYNMLLGLKYIHSAGVYHRDMKPANCLVNQDCSVKICDFGLARAAHVHREPPRGSVLPSQETSPTRGTGSVDSAAPRRPVLRRQLTGHVVTRWYRAPELILLQPDYTEAIDVWASGCIMAELFAMHWENARHPTEREPLFPGSSCFPLSPDHKTSSNAAGVQREHKDQLNAILGVIGTPGPAEIDELEGDEAKKYISCFPKRRAVDLQTRYPGTSAIGIDLLKKMLQFNANKRITLAEALSHPFLADVRQRGLERTHANGPVVLAFESETELDEMKLRRYVSLEIRKFHPELELPDDC